MINKEPLIWEDLTLKSYPASPSLLLYILEDEVDTAEGKLPHSLADRQSSLGLAWSRGQCLQPTRIARL